MRSILMTLYIDISAVLCSGSCPILHWSDRWCIYIHAHEHHSWFPPTINLFIKVINPIYLIYIIKFSNVRYSEIVFHTTLCHVRYSEIVFHTTLCHVRYSEIVFQQHYVR